ncbi:hypothetical protein GE09DRAFT_1058545 [Coniochaeta sp. 2T2.1]|nr:hypothetical protein GE09DRAFT_1058545 [Coniochaeta sp. 2T2.1]
MPPSIHASVDGFATPLGLAAERGHVAQVSYLIHRGADANIAGKDGVSPLTHAFLGLETRAEKSTYEQRPDPTPYLKIITKLLERGANPTLNMSAEYDEWAAPRYPLTYVFELLSLGIIKTGQTIRLVKLLIRCGADPNTVDNQGHAPTHIIVSLNEPA